MKIIDLLNKIANGEIKLGTKFNWHYKLYDIELIFTERQGALGLYFQKEDRLIGLFERFNYQILNDEVEILEEKKILEKLDHLIGYDIQQFDDLKEYVEITTNDLFGKINKVIDTLDNLIDYLKSKGE